MTAAKSCHSERSEESAVAVFETVLTVHRNVIADLDFCLDAPEAAGQRTQMKNEIVALYKTIDRQMTDLAALKGSVKALADKWKAQQQGSAPEFAVERPVVHADHLGASTFVEKGWSLLSLGDYAAAEQALVRALELAPNDPHAEALMGWALMLQEKYDDALGRFQKVLVSEPQNALARINVGYICLKKQIFGEAIEHLSRAIKLDNDRKATLYAHFYLGLVYFEREMYQDAQAFFQATIQLGPNFVQAYYELGRAYALNGQAEAANRVWMEGYGVNKFNPWGKRCAEAAASA
jgi:tetratricopeptide (TPR) repeat protein